MPESHLAMPMTMMMTMTMAVAVEMTVAMAVAVDCGGTVTQRGGGRTNDVIYRRFDDVIT